MSLIISLLNTIAVIATLGLLVYSKILYKKPKITEESEKKHLAVVYASPKPPPVPAWLKFESITVNIAPTPADAPENKDNAPERSNLHYVTTGFSLQIADQSKTDYIESARPFIVDQIITLLGRKKAQELSTVQGRYILKSQLLEILNKKIAELTHDKSNTPVVTNLYFDQFIVQ